jgi:pimeloyl-ACP methyl ester carboxylesterase/DNA-binding winged helix-turn-helix (wHTH) protein
LPFVFGDYSLDAGRRELRRDSVLVQLEPQVFDLLIYLIENRDRVVSKDDLIASVWHGRIVSESTLTSRITAARKAIGDSGERQALIRTMARKGIRFTGDVSERAALKEPTAPPSAAPPSGNLPPATHLPTPQHLASHILRQEVHFCTSSDGTQIAYASVGQGSPVIKTANWLNHLEFDWESPVWSPLFQAIASEHQLIRYDARGNGLSDWDTPEMSFDTFVRDLETVVDAVGVKRFALFGISQGCAMSIAYAVRYPERVSHLVLYGSFARGRKKRGTPEGTANSDALITLIRQGWGQENPAFRQLFTSLFIPGGTEEQTKWFNDLQRITTSPENAARLRQVVDDIEVTALLPKVTAPTLVLHCRGDAVQPFDEGRRLAAGIPGARFVALEGRNHIPLQGEPAWSRLLQEMTDFLRS